MNARACDPLPDREEWRKLLDPVRGWYDDGGTIEVDPSDEEILRHVVDDFQHDSKDLLKLLAWIQCVVRNLNDLNDGDVDSPLWSKVSYMLGMGEKEARELIESMEGLDPDDT